MEYPGNHITQYNNFANFPQALLVMIRCEVGTCVGEASLKIAAISCHLEALQRVYTCEDHL